MALHTGVGFLILSFSVLHCHPTAGLMSVFSSHRTGGWLSRKLIPAAIGAPSLLGWLALAMSQFLGNTRLTIASIVVSQIVLFVALIWFLSFLINRSEVMLQVSEKDRAETRQALSKSEELLRQSQKVEAVGQLAAGIAHDFNNLLAVIVGYSDLLLTGPHLEEPQRAKVGKIKQAGDSAASLTRQLLAFSRQQLVQPTILDLNNVLAHMDGILHRLIREDVELIMSLDPNIGTVRADQGQIEQVLINLVVNASDAMPDGGKLHIGTLSTVIDVSTAQRFGVAPGQFVKLSVTDNGMGMSPEVKARAFEPFYTTKPAGKGTGLGLSTVYGIVRQSGGLLDVKSTMGVGSSFRIHLPVVVVEKPVPSAEPKPVRLRGSETVLVVEDAPHLRDLVAESLQQHGYKVLLAESGTGALEICDRHEGPIDLVITDVIMPEMNGRALVEHLKIVRPEARIIFMSGYTNDVIVRHGVFNADVAFIPKPFTPAELAKKVAQVLGHTQSSVGS
jgi:signal transduction histidine kinase/ActR/RegA family two-component response regulator